MVQHFYQLPEKKNTDFKEKKNIQISTWSEPNTPTRPLFRHLGVLRLTEYIFFIMPV